MTLTVHPTTEPGSLSESLGNLDASSSPTARRTQSCPSNLHSFIGPITPKDYGIIANVEDKSRITNSNNEEWYSPKRYKSSLPDTLGERENVAFYFMRSHTALEKKTPDETARDVHNLLLLPKKNSSDREGEVYILHDKLLGLVKFGSTKVSATVRSGKINSACHPTRPFQIVPLQTINRLVLYEHLEQLIFADLIAH